MARTAVAAAAPRPSDEAMIAAISRMTLGELTAFRRRLAALKLRAN